jgi:hypothetical protein
MHARRIHPDEKRLVGLDLPLHKIDGRGGGLIIDRLHALFVERPGILDGLPADFAEARIDCRIVASLALLLITPRGPNLALNRGSFG